MQGLGLTALGAAAAYYGTIFFGIMDYLYQPECFRAGDLPEPSSETAPGQATVEPGRVRAAGSDQVVTLHFTAGPGGISEDGGIKVGLCHLARLSRRPPPGRPGLALRLGYPAEHPPFPAQPLHRGPGLPERRHAGGRDESLPCRYGWPCA